MPIDSIIVIITVIIAFGFCELALFSLRFR
jgi:hypothetical protein